MTESTKQPIGDELDQLDPFTAERLLRGVDPRSAPAGLGQVAALFETLRQPANAAELAAQAEVVTALVAACAVPAVALQGTSINSPKAGKRMLGKLLTAKVASVAAGVLFFGGAAAAATGTMPFESLLSSPAAEAALVTTAVEPESSTSSPTTAKPADESPPDDPAGESLDDAASGASPPTTPTTTPSATPSVTPSVTPTTETTTGTTTGTTTAEMVECENGNHGKTVSAVARSRDDDGEGTHGEAVSKAAHSDCGKDSADDSDDSDEADEADDDAGKGTSSKAVKADAKKSNKGKG